MQSYTVHLKAGGRIEDATFVPDRWSWPAFVFGPFWLAFHRQWLALAGFVIIYAVLTAIGIATGLHPAAASALSTLLNAAVALEGHNIRRWTLERTGAPRVAVVAGRTLEEAEVRFFTEFRPSTLPSAAPATQAQSHPAQATPQPAAVLGLFPQPGGRL